MAQCRNLAQQKICADDPQVFAHAARAEMVSFTSFYDQHDNHFPLDSAATPIETIEMFKDGKMYSLGP